MHNDFSVNDSVDLLAEILGRLDGRSLAIAACVCRLWTAVSRRDSVWEAVCIRQVSCAGARPYSSSSSSSLSGVGSNDNTRSVVAALGGYRRLYRLCVGPALDRLAGSRRSRWWAVAGEEATHLSLSLSLSLFSIECYERSMGGGGGGGGGGRAGQRPASLLFLCNPVDVS